MQNPLPATNIPYRALVTIFPGTQNDADIINYRSTQVNYIAYRYSMALLSCRVALVNGSNLGSAPLEDLSLSNNNKYHVELLHLKVLSHVDYVMILL